MSFAQRDTRLDPVLQELIGQEISVTYVSAELTISFQARVETVLDASSNEVALLLSQGGRIIASGANLRRAANGITFDIGCGKRLYLSRILE